MSAKREMGYPRGVRPVRFSIHRMSAGAGVMSCLLMVLFCSCGKSPSAVDIQNIKTIAIHTDQQYQHVDKEITLPLEAMLEEVLKVMDITVVTEDEAAGAVLRVNLKGRPHRATFPQQKKTYYEAATVTGTASLALQGFAAKKAKLYGRKHYYSTTYYEMWSNSDPRVPLKFAATRAFMKMFIDLWGPASLLSVWQTYYAFVFGTTDWHELDEVIRKEDEQEVIPVIMQALASDNPLIKENAIKMLTEMTRPKEIHVPRKSEYRIELMSSKVRKAVLQHLDVIIEAARDENPEVRRMAFDILPSFGRDAAPALPLIHEWWESGNSDEQYSALKAMGKIEPPEKSLPVLMDVLKNGKGRVLLAALSTLEDMGSEAKKAIPLIIPYLQDQDIFARMALEAISGEKLGNSPEAWQQWWDRQ